jgi:hypothetical protein
VREVQPVVGWASVRSNVDLEGVGVALVPGDEAVGDAGDIAVTVGHD